MEPLELDLPLRTIRNESLYWEADEVPNNGRSNFKLIIVSDGTAETDNSYVIPEYEYPGLIKVRLLYCMCSIIQYRITRFFRWEFIFALFASDVESAKNCEILIVGAIFRNVTPGVQL